MRRLLVGGGMPDHSSTDILSRQRVGEPGEQRKGVCVKIPVSPGRGSPEESKIEACRQAGGGQSIKAAERLELKLSDAMTRARAMQRGGVGWYPQSGFIHIDYRADTELDSRRARRVTRDREFKSGFLRRRVCSHQLRGSHDSWSIAI
jgi:hypothetical protein